MIFGPRSSPHTFKPQRTPRSQCELCPQPNDPTIPGDRRFRPSTVLRIPSMVEGRMGADTVDDVIHHEEHEEQEGERQKNAIQSGIPPSSPFFVFFIQ